MNDTPPRVSVILPAYQHAAFVERAVRSVLEQSMRDLELIVVDDASTDGTADIVAGIRDERLQLIRSPQNRLLHARNHALGLSRGEYIAFQNSDDEWLPDKLEQQLEALQQQDRVAMFTDVQLIDQDSAAVAGSWASDAFKAKPLSTTPDDWLRLLFQGNSLCISSALIRRSALERTGPFKPALLQLSDMDLWIRLAGVGNLAVLPGKLTRMRILPGRNLSTPTAEAINRALIEHSELLENYLHSPIFERLHDVFPEAGIPAHADATLRKAAFALYCSGQGIPHRLFADRQLSAILNRPLEREIAQNAYGNTLIKQFWQTRGTLQLVDAAQPVLPKRTFLQRLKRVLGRSLQ